MTSQRRIPAIQFVTAILLATLSIAAHAQTARPRQDSHFWYFGHNAGIRFDAGGAVAVAGGRLSTDEGSTAISDRFTGDLRFYTNGLAVWDRGHNVMPNGTGLLGHWSSTQSALAVPDPADSLGYYIFTAGAVYPLDDPSLGFRYSKVDMRLNNGMGDVTAKNVMLMASGTEKLTATRHCNRRDYWVVTHEWGSSEFRAWLVSPAGVTGPVVSEIGPIYRRDPNDKVNTAGFATGAIKISPNGNKLAAANQWLYMAELYDFDKATGVVSNRVLLDSGSYHWYGTEFSPDNSKLYFEAESAPLKLFQWDLSNPDPAAINASKTDLRILQESRSGGHLQLGPDGRIYTAFYNYTYLGAILNPNAAGLACGFVEPGLTLKGISWTGLPGVINSDLFAPMVDTSDLRITKNVNDTLPMRGDTITYTITVCNRSACMQAYNVVVEDNLPAGLEYVDGFSAYPRHTFDTIRPGECRSVRLRARVTAAAPGNTIITNCATIIDSSPFYGVIPGGENCADIRICEIRDQLGAIDFGEVACCADSMRWLTLRNECGNAVTIVGIIGPRSDRFTVLAPALPLTLRREGNAAIGIAFRPHGIGAFADSIALIVLARHDGKLDTIPVPLAGTGVPLRVSARIGMDYKAYPGHYVETPIELLDPLDCARLNRLRITFTYDPAMALMKDPIAVAAMLEGTLLENWVVETLKNERGELTITLRAPQTTTTLVGTGVILRPMLRLVLADRLQTDLRFTITPLDDACAEVAAIPGRAAIDSVCGVSLRMIELIPFNKVAIETIRPNPLATTTTIHFMTIADGAVRLELVGTNGAVERVLVDGVIPAGPHQAELDTRGIPSGVYFCRLRSGGTDAMVKVIIMK